MNAMLEMFLKVLVMLNADVNLKCQAKHNLFTLTGLNFKIIHQSSLIQNQPHVRKLMERIFMLSYETNNLLIHKTKTFQWKTSLIIKTMHEQAIN